MPEISVIITTYKRKNEIVVRAVNSLRKQTFSDIEIIVVDDNDKPYVADNNLEKALKDLEDDRVRYIWPGKNQGACVARNAGIHEAKARYICFLDDDDEYLPHKLDMQYKELSKSDAGMIICSFYMFEEATGKIIHSRMKYNETENMFDQLIADNHIATPNPLIKKECFEKCGGFDAEMPSAQDLEMWLRIAKKYKILVSKDELYIQHLHEGERITSNHKKKLAGNRMLVEKYIDYMREHKAIYSRYLFRQCKFCLRLGKKWEAFRMLLKGMIICPLKAPKGILLFIYWILGKN